MFCPNCGTQLPDGAKFCGSCGKQLGAAPARPAAPPRPTAPAGPAGGYRAPAAPAAGYGAYAPRPAAALRQRPTASGFAELIHRLASSPLFLIATILATAHVVLGIIEVATADLFEWMELLCELPELVLVIGLWVIYGSSFGRSASGVGGGLTTARAMELTIFVFICIFYALAMFYLLLNLLIYALKADTPDFMVDIYRWIHTNEFPSDLFGLIMMRTGLSSLSYVFDAEDTVLFCAISMVLITVVFVLYCKYHHQIIHSMASAKETVERPEQAPYVPSFAGTGIFLFAGISLAVKLFTIIELSDRWGDYYEVEAMTIIRMILALAVGILFGIIYKKHRANVNAAPSRPAYGARY